MAYINQWPDGYVEHEKSKTQLLRKILVSGSFKRITDIILSFSALVFFAPVFLLIAIILKMTSKGPILFSQERYGLNKKTFRILKFRTMHVEACKASFAQATKNDGRVTKFGAFLRATSLDEFPQFYNVLRGDMSIVGPRPHVMSMDDEFALLNPHYDDRFTVRPGITGLSQCKGFRGPTVTPKAKIGRIARDLFYVRERTIILDFQIMMQTAVKLFTQNAF